MKHELLFATLGGLFVAVPLGTAAGSGRSGDLMTAVIHCDVEALTEALANGASANWAHPATGESALHYSVQCESGKDGAQYGLVQRLLAAGAVASALAVDGTSVLERALLFGSEPTIELLLESGADPRALTTVGVSMPAVARIVGNGSAERALRERGAELSVSDLEAV